MARKHGDGPSSPKSARKGTKSPKHGGKGEAASTDEKGHSKKHYKGRKERDEGKGQTAESVRAAGASAVAKEKQKEKEKPEKSKPKGKPKAQATVASDDVLKPTAAAAKAKAKPPAKAKPNAAKPKSVAADVPSTVGSSSSLPLDSSQIRAKMRDEVVNYARHLRDVRYAEWATAARAGSRRGVIPSRLTTDFKLWSSDAAAVTALAAALSQVSSAHSKRVALLGNNGDGKSTLLNLLMILFCMSETEYKSALPVGYTNEALLRARRRISDVGEEEESPSPEGSFCLPEKCSKKRLLLPTHEAALCTACLRWYHIDCVSYSTRVKNGQEFVCPLCISVAPESFPGASASEPAPLPWFNRVPKHSARDMERLQKHERETVFEPLESTCEGADSNFRADFLLPTGRSGSVTTTCNVRVVYGRTFALCVEYWPAEKLQEAAFEFRSVMSGTGPKSKKSHKRKQRASDSSSESSGNDSEDSSSDSGSSDSDNGLESRADERTYARRFHSLTGNAYARPLNHNEGASENDHLGEDPLTITDMDSLKAISSPADVQLSDLALDYAKLRAQAFVGDGKSMTGDRVFVRDELRKLMPSLVEASENASSRTRAYCVKDVTVFVPSQLLESGLELLDIPGVNDTDTLNKGLTHDGLAKSSHIIAVDRRNLKANESLQEALKDHVLQRLADREKGFGLTLLLMPEVQARQGPDMFLTREGSLHSEWEMARKESITALSDMMVGFLGERFHEKSKLDLDQEARSATKGVSVFTLFPKLFASMRLNAQWQQKHGDAAVATISRNTDARPFLHMLKNISAQASHDAVLDAVAHLQHGTKKLIDRLLNDVFKVRGNVESSSAASDGDERLFQRSIPSETMRRLQDSSLEYFSSSRVTIREHLHEIVDEFFGLSGNLVEGEDQSWFQELSAKAPRVLRKRFKVFRRRNKHRYVKGKRPRFRVSTSALRNALTVSTGDTKGLDLRKLFFSGLRPTTRTDVLLARLREAVNKACVQLCVESLTMPILQHCVSRDLVQEVFSNSNSKSAKLQRAEKLVRDYLAQAARDELVADAVKITFESPGKLLTVRSIANLSTHAEKHAILHVVQSLTKKHGIDTISRSKMITALGRAMAVPNTTDSSKRRRTDRAPTVAEAKPGHRTKKNKKAASKAEVDSVVDEPLSTLPRATAHALSKIRELVSDRVVERFTLATNRTFITTKVGIVESFLDRNHDNVGAAEEPWMSDLRVACSELDRTCSKLAAFLERLNADSAAVSEDDVVHRAQDALAHAPLVTDAAVRDYSTLRSSVAEPSPLPTNADWPPAQPRTWVQDLHAAGKAQEDLLNWIKPADKEPNSETGGLWSMDAFDCFESLGLQVTTKPDSLIETISQLAFKSAESPPARLREALLAYLEVANIHDGESTLAHGHLQGLFAVAAVLGRRVRLWIPRGIGVKEGCKMELRVFSAQENPIKSTKNVTDFDAFDIAVAWISSEGSRLKKDRKVFFAAVNVSPNFNLASKEGTTAERPADPEIAKSKKTSATPNGAAEKSAAAGQTTLSASKADIASAASSLTEESRGRSGSAKSSPARDKSTHKRHRAAAGPTEESPMKSGSDVSSPDHVKVKHKRHRSDSATAEVKHKKERKRHKHAHEKRKSEKKQSKKQLS